MASLARYEAGIDGSSLTTCWRRGGLECDCTIPAARRRSSQSTDQEARELIFIHLADAHRKVAVADTPGAADMAIDRNIERWISAHQVDDFIAEKRRIGARFACIAADEFVTPEHPKVTRLRAALAPSGLRITQFSILRKLARLGPVPVTRLAAEAALDRSTMGRNLNPLERRGLVRIEVGRRRPA